MLNTDLGAENVIYLLNFKSPHMQLSFIYKVFLKSLWRDGEITIFVIDLALLNKGANYAYVWMMLNYLFFIRGWCFTG